MSTDNKADDQYVEVPAAALVAVQQMLSKEGLDDLSAKISRAQQVDLDAFLAKVGSLGINIAGVDTGHISFAESIESAKILGSRLSMDNLIQTRDTKAKIKPSVIAELQNELRKRPDIIARNMVAKAVDECDADDPFNCPRDWPSLISHG
ncbi:hypothetical protein ACLBYG_19490 [Methylobacterium sp. D53M]|jgi:hypothetical protein